MEKIDKDDLSGVYIRNLLMKQLTSSSSSSRSKLDPLSSENHDVEKEEPKKKIRRRLHTSKPYQEKLLNMAEIRKEIVTALKFHRAAMENHHQQPQPQPQPPKAKLQESYPYASFSCSNYSYPYPYPWTLPAIAPPVENLHLSLPNQLPLGLNLNLHDFNIHNSSIYSSTSSSPCPSTSSSSSPSLYFLIEEVATSGIINQQLMNIDSGLQCAMDNKETEEIRPVGEQQLIEWNDTMNLEIDSEENDEEDYGQFPFDEINVVEIPSWLKNSNENESSFFDDYCSQDYMQDAALPCMEIEEIEGMDGEWLSSS